MRSSRAAVVAWVCALLVSGCVQTGSGVQSALGGATTQDSGPVQDASPATSAVPAQAQASTPTQEAQATPADAPAAFHGLGKLAFVRDGKLQLLDGQTDTLRAAELGAWSPVWSADGAWLAFGQDGRVVLVEAATAKARELTGLPGQVDGFAWAPSGHVLAVSAGGAIWRVAEPAAPELERLATVETPAGSLVWSPDGRRIAFERTLPETDPTTRTSLLEVLDLESGRISPWYRAERTYIYPAGWWPDSRGMLLWVANGWCNSCNADGVPLRSLALGTDKPADLGVMMVSHEWIAWRPDSRREFLMVRGGDRFIPEGKEVAICEAGLGECRELPHPAGTVTLDPSWSPDGSQVAFVQAPGWKLGEATNTAKTLDWVSNRRLWIARPDGTEAHEVASAGGGIYGPKWSGDGRHLLYIKDGALWVLDLQTDRTQRVVGLGESASPKELWYRSGWPYSVAWYQP